MNIKADVKFKIRAKKDSAEDVSRQMLIKQERIALKDKYISRVPIFKKEDLQYEAS